MIYEKLALARGDYFTNAELTSVIVQDCSNTHLLRWIDLLLTDESMLAEVARQSYRHQLGFRKFVLMTDGEGRSLRLHLWDMTTTAPEDIHSHCANFLSRVVLGGFEENSFDLVDGNSYARFRYHFDPALGHSVAVKEGTTGVHLRECRVLPNGSIYMRNACELHNVTNVVQGTLTVSAWGARDSEAIVIKSVDASPEDCVAVPGMSVDEMRSVLNDIKGKLVRK